MPRHEALRTREPLPARAEQPPPVRALPGPLAAPPTDPSLHEKARRGRREVAAAKEKVEEAKEKVAALVAKGAGQPVEEQGEMLGKLLESVVDEQLAEEDVVAKEEVAGGYAEQLAARRSGLMADAGACGPGASGSGSKKLLFGGSAAGVDGG